jgi:hypothetical protein
MMKKLFALLLAVAALVTLGTVAVFAELPGSEIGVYWTPGGYSADTFRPVGDIAITWDPEAASKLDLSDGDMSDWAAAGYDVYTIDTTNMVYWVCDTINGTGIPAGWSISAYFVADREWLYFGFFVTDPAFAYIDAGNYQSGDSIQFNIDFGGRLGKMLKENPEDVWHPKNIFYSFGCAADGAPIEIMRQESDNDAWISEANGDGVKGAARKTAYGWSAEFAMSWQQMYEDYRWKSWDDKQLYIGGDARIPLEIGCNLIYLDRSETNDTLHWAASSTNGIADDAGTPQVSWTAYDNGIGLYLPYEENMRLKCDGIVDMGRGYQTVPPSPETETEPAPETEPTPEPQRPETQKPTESTPPEVVTKPQPAPPAESDPLPMDEELEMLLDKYGCSGVIGTGALSALMVAAAWVLLCKKKD